MNFKSLRRRFAVASLWLLWLTAPTRVDAVQADIDATAKSLEVRLASNDLRGREEALEELTAIKLHGPEIMLLLMKSPNEVVRTQSYIAVRITGVRDERIFQALFEGLDRVASMPGWVFLQDLDEGYELARAIRSMGKDGIVKALDHIDNPRPAARATAALAVYAFLEDQALGNHSEHGDRELFTLPDRIVERLVDFVDDDYPPMRMASIDCLMFADLQGDAKTKFIRALAPRLKESEFRILMTALEAIKYLKLAHPDLVPPLVRAFGNNDDRDWIQAEVANVIAGMGEVSEPAIPYLINEFQTGEASVRANALIALTGIGREDPAVAELIKSAQHDPDERVRELAAKALGVEE